MKASITISDINPRYVHHLLRLARFFAEEGSDPDTLDWSDALISLQTLMEFMGSELPEGDEHSKAFFTRVDDALETGCEAIRSLRRREDVGQHE